MLKNMRIKEAASPLVRPLRFCESMFSFFCRPGICGGRAAFVLHPLEIREAAVLHMPHLAATSFAERPAGIAKTAAAPESGRHCHLNHAACPIDPADADHIAVQMPRANDRLAYLEYQIGCIYEHV